MGIYWPRKYSGKQEEQPWYLLTNLPNLLEAVTAYKKRVGIAVQHCLGGVPQERLHQEETMFKDCKSGGYNLEGSKASLERLTRLV